MSTRKNEAVRRSPCQKETADSGRGYMPALDAIRGAAALVVVVRHSTAFLGSNPFPHSHLAVDLFFVMSGLVLWTSYAHRLAAEMTPYDFIRARLVRLYPLYLLGTLIGLGVAVHAAVPSASEAVLALLMLPDPRHGTGPAFPFDAPGWSLSVEVLGSIAFALLATRAKPRRLLAIAAMGLAVTAVLATMKPEHDFNMGFTSRNLPGGLTRATAGFCLGIFLGQYVLPSLEALTGRLPHLLREGVLWTWLPIVAAIALLAMPVPRSLCLPYDITAVALGFPALLAFAAVARPGPRTTRVFKLAGVASFPLYAIHVPVEDGIAAAIARFAGPAGLHCQAIGYAILPALVVLALACDRLIDRPVRRLLSQRRTARADVDEALVTHCLVSRYAL